jgi:hypothetical protein
MLDDESYYNYTLSENGKPVHYGSAVADYSTDVFAREAKEIIRSSAGDDRPLFMYLAPSAPHLPGSPAPRHEELFEDVRARARHPSTRRTSPTSRGGYASSHA